MSANEKSSTEKMKEKFADKELSAEQMEDVSGGTKRELQEGLSFLHRILVLDDPKIQKYIHDRELAWIFYPVIQEIWKKVGIDAQLKINNQRNRYFANGKELTFDEAKEYATEYAREHGILKPGS